MKTFLLSLFLFIQTSLAVAQGYSSDTTLMIVGSFSLKINLVRGIEVNLYSDGKRIDSMIVAGNQEFGFYLKRNKTYIIEVKKEGFIRKTLNVSTEIPDDIIIKAKQYYNFGFLMPLVRMPDNDDGDKYVKYINDVPTAYIFFNEEINKFDYGREYAKNLKSKIKDAKRNAKAKK